MTPHQIFSVHALPLALAAALGANLTMVAAIAAVKIMRERSEAYAARIRESVTDAAISYLEDETRELTLPAPVTRAATAALEPVISLIATLKGHSRDRLIAALESNGYIDRLCALLRSRSASARAQAASILGACKSIAAVPILERALTADPSPEVRICAAEALGSIGYAPSIPLLLQAAREPSKYQELRLAGVLAAIGAQAIAPIEEALDANDPRLTSLLLDVLIDIGGITGPARIAALLEHRSPEVRARAATLLGAAGAIDAAGALAYATRDPMWFVRLRIVKALAQLGVPYEPTERARYLETLTHLLYDDNWFVRRNAAAALAQAGEAGEAILRRHDTAVARSALELSAVRRGRGAATVL